VFALRDGALSPIGLTEVMKYSHAGEDVLRTESPFETGLAEGTIDGFTSTLCVCLPV